MSQPENTLTPGYANAIAAALNLGLAMLGEVERNIEAFKGLEQLAGVKVPDEVKCRNHSAASGLIAQFAEALELVRLAADQGRQS